MEVKKRTFEAEKYPKGSPERVRLNMKALTSEYYHSMKYIIVDDTDRGIHVYRTKKEAQNNLS
jgi:hypothetical protein